MPRLLLINPGGTPGEIVLHPGTNRIGRAEDNHHQIADASVSTHHCEVIVSESGCALIRDLGSTNGTFADSMRIEEAALVEGQAVRLGSVEMVFFAEGETRIAARPAPVRVRLTNVSASSEAEIDLSMPSARAVATAPMDLPEPRLRREPERQRKTFFNLFLGAFAYPLKKNGPMMLVCGTIFFGLLDFAANFLGGLISMFLVVLTVGYLFTYMESIVNSSAQGETEMPSWPEFSDYIHDILFPFLRFTSVWAVCLGPGIVTMIVWHPVIGMVVLGIGLFCAPMALLAVAMAGSIGGLNPFVIFPSIAKVPLEYLLVCGLLLIVLGMQGALRFALEAVDIPIVPAAVATFLGLYGITVEMRLLGLLYHTRKDRLAWF
jgi:pSer/pThr/pTyr-binding forkhead associated (FHA) protein